MLRICSRIGYFACVKHFKLEKIISTAFYAANYSDLNETQGKIFQ